MISKHFNAIKGYVHSLEEPTKELFDKINKAIEEGLLQGVQAINDLAETIAPQPTLQPVRVTNQSNRTLK